jgi:hypothetical protein
MADVQAAPAPPEAPPAPAAAEPPAPVKAEADPPAPADAAAAADPPPAVKAEPPPAVKAEPPAGAPAEPARAQSLTFNWTSPAAPQGHLFYYTSFSFCDAPYAVGEFVYLIPEEVGAPLYLARIVSAFEDTAAEGSERLCIQVGGLVGGGAGDGGGGEEQHVCNRPAPAAATVRLPAALPARPRNPSLPSSPRPCLPQTPGPVV